MSLMGMRRTVKQYGTPIWILLALILVVGSFVGLGSNLFDNGQQAQGVAEPVLATVGDRKVLRSEVDDRVMQMTANPPPQQMNSMRLYALEEFKQQGALVAVAKSAGVSVTDAEVESARNEAWKQQRTTYITALNLKPTATDDEISRTLARQRPDLSVETLKEGYPKEQLRLQATVKKLQDKFKAEAQKEATEEEVRRSYADMQVRHILVKFGKGALPEAQARTKAQKLLDAVKTNPSAMATLAKENSDDPGSKAKGGQYTWAPADRAGIVPEFKEALRKLQPGQTFPELVRVENPGYAGFHIIRLDSVKPGKDLPKDFDKNKANYLTQYVEQSANQRLQEAITKATPNVKVVVQDPLLRSAQLQQEAQQSPDPKERDAKLNQALAQLAKVKAGDDPSGVAAFQRASLYEALNNTKQAIAAHTDALKFRDNLETRLALAQLHLKDNNKTAAIAQLQETEKQIRGEVYSQRQLADLYRQAGRTDLAAQATTKLQEMEKRQAAIARTPPGGNIPAPPVPSQNEGDNKKSGG